MLNFLMVLYGLSLTEAYNIKITGKVELGSELSRLFKQAYVGLTPTDLSNADSPGNAEHAATDNVPTEYKNNNLNNNEDEPAKDLTVLEKMVQNEQDTVHLYGNHKLKGDNDGRPLNNIHLRAEE